MLLSVCGHRCLMKKERFVEASIVEFLLFQNVRGHKMVWSCTRVYEMCLNVMHSTNPKTFFASSSESKISKQIDERKNKFQIKMMDILKRLQGLTCCVISPLLFEWQKKVHEIFCSFYSHCLFVLVAIKITLNTHASRLCLLSDCPFHPFMYRKFIFVIWFNGPTKRLRVIKSIFSLLLFYWKFIADHIDMDFCLILAMCDTQNEIFPAYLFFFFFLFYCSFDLMIKWLNWMRDGT